MKVRPCELCPSDAAVFCPSDAAFLCWSCDANIHEANFLVARHVRQSICSTCNELTVSGESVCISSTTSVAKENSDGDSCSSSSGRRRRPWVDYFKAEGIFVNWCGKLGMEVDLVAVQMACKALKVCLGRRSVLPLRVCLAASMWLGLKVTLDKCVLTSKVLKRFEEISGVPAKLILAAVSKLDRALSKDPLHLELEEGWAETDS